MRIFFAVILLMLPASCATTMSPEQMAQNVKDKNAVVGCAFGTGLYGHGGAVYVDTNRIADNQSVTISGECQVNITGSKSAPPAKTP